MTFFKQYFPEVFWGGLLVLCLIGFAFLEITLQSVERAMLVDVPVTSLRISPERSYLTVGNTQDFAIRLDAPSGAINAVGGVVNFDPALLEVVDFSVANSLVELWVEEPHVSSDNGTIDFSGGVLTGGGFTGLGNIFVVKMKAIRPGQANLSITAGEALLGNGLGTNALGQTTGAAVFVRAAGALPADINGDGRVDVADMGMLLSSWGRSDLRFDLTQDGRVDMADLGVVIAALRKR